MRTTSGGPNITTNGLILYYDAANPYSYVNGSTVWRDLTANGNDGTLTNGPTFVSENGGSLSFDATNDTVSTPLTLSSLSALSNFSIDCWVKIDSYPTAASPNQYNKTTRNGVLVGAASYAGTAIYWTGNSSGTSLHVYGYIRGTDLYRITTLYQVTTLGRYYNFTIVNNYTSGTFALYANGILYSSVNGPTQEYNTSFAATAGNIGINKPQVDGGGENVYSYLQCNVPMLKIYNRALTASQILQNYNANKSRFNLQ